MPPIDDLPDHELTRADFGTRAEWLRYRRANLLLPTDEEHPDFQEAMTLPWEKDKEDGRA